MRCRRIVLGAVLALLGAGSGRAQETGEPELERIQVGATVRGTIAGGSAREFVLVAAADGPITIGLDSFDFDAQLRVQAEGSAEIAADDGGVETNARVVLQARAGARHRVTAVAKGEGGGEFALSIAAGNVPAPAGNALGDAAVAFHSTAASRALARRDQAAGALHLRRAGELLVRQRKYAAAKAPWEACLALARELGDGAGEARSLGSLGNIYLALGEHGKARELHEQRLAVSRGLGDRSGVATALGNLGIVCWKLADYRAAKAYAEQHLALAQELEDRKGEATAYANLGNACRSLGDLVGALDHYARGLDVSRDLGEWANEALALRNLGVTYLRLGDYPKAREHHELHRARAREQSDRREELTALGNLGNVHALLRDHPRAWELYENALALARELGDRLEQARCLGNLGSVYSSLEDHPRAREHGETLLALVRELGRRQEEATALGNLGKVCWSLGDYPKARSYHEQCLALARELGERDDEARALGNLGTVLSALGDYSKARDCHEQQLALARQTRQRRYEAHALMGLGNVCSSRGDHPKAREHHERALALYRELGDREGEAKALGNLGNVYHGLSDHSRAREHYEQQLALARELGSRSGEAMALGNLAVVQRALGDPAKAQELRERHLALARELGNRKEEARALLNLGVGAHALGDYAKAREHHEASLGLARALGDRDGEARALQALAAAHCALGDHPAARQSAAAALSLWSAIGVEERRIATLATLARVALRERKPDEASQALEEAVRLLDRLPTAALDHHEVAGLRSSFAAIGPLVADLAALRVAKAADPAARADAIAQGFAAAGRWKGLALLEGIAEHRAGGRSAQATRLRRERQEALAERDGVLQGVSHAIRAGEPSTQVDRRRAEAAALLARAEDLARRLREVSPRDAALDVSGSVPVESVRRVLPPGTALLDYAEGEERLYVFVVTQHDLHFLDLGPGQAVREAVTGFVASTASLESLGSTQEVAANGRALGDVLLAPARRAAGAGIDRLAIVPTSGLSGLAFEALVLGTRGNAAPRSFADVEFVLDRYEVSYAPSAPVLVEIGRLPSPRASDRALVLADPFYPAEDHAAAGAGTKTAAATTRADHALGWQRLQKTREEARTLGRLLLSREAADRSVEEALRAALDRRHGSLSTASFDLHLGSQASRERLAGDLRRYSVLHLAAHGYAGSRFPCKAGLVLAFAPGQDGYFTVMDVLDLDLDADLVVLSACDTARGEVLPGEGIESVARAFMYAGADGVVASLWQVADWAAAETMGSFYGSWLAGDRAQAQAALRAAKRAVRSSRAVRGIAPPGASGTSRPIESGHPFFWAPFVYLGLPG